FNTAENWGIKSNIIRVSYGTVVLSIVRYGLVLLYDVVNKILVKRNLAIQRVLLLLTTKIQLRR
ncbi:unnamed protein product, partial [Heterotrigona itama]